MAHNHFPTPWDASPENWEAMGISAALIHPGLSDDCSAPKLGAAPVVHRFIDIFIDRNQVPFPDMRCHDSEVSEQFFKVSDGESACGINEDCCDRDWQVRRPLWASAVTFEQAWYWLGSSLGELNDSISLTPNEELEVQVFTWDRTKSSRDLESTDLVDKRMETTLTVHDSAHVVNRMEHQRQWQLGANVGFSYGITAGIEANLGESLSDSIERRREQRQEQTRKTAQQIRSERRFKVSTTREMGYEQRHRRMLRNANPVYTVTYNFYETVSHYRVDLALVETQTAIAIPNLLPRITPAWVTCHEGTLRDHLLDKTHEAGFDAANDLMRGSDAERDVVAAAAARLREAFQERRTHDTEAESEEAVAPPSFWDALGRSILAGLTLGGSESIFRPVDIIADILEQEPSNNVEERPTGEEIEEFLAGITETPSFNGLLVALKLVGDYHVPWYLGRWGRYHRYRYYPMTDAIKRALGYAKAVSLAMSETVPAQISGSDETSDEETPASQSPWFIWRSEQDEIHRNWRASQALFNALRCHIEENLLHYMRPIWVAEDPAVRLKRHAREMGLSPDALRQLVKQPLIGFHLNCCVYPCENQEFANVVPIMFSNGATLKSRAQAHFQKSASHRFERDAAQMLNRATRDAVRDVVSCGKKEQQLTADVLPSIIERIAGRIAAERDDFAKQDGWQTYLTDRERKSLQRIWGRADEWETAATEARREIEEGRLTALRDAYVSVTEEWRERLEKRDFRSIMISLPDGGYHCEPVVGRCSAADHLRLQELEAALRKLQGEADQARAEADRRRKRVDELEAGELSEPAVPTVHVQLSSED